jgi:peptidoglycan/LPS O-acetylase OafA/YrhL
MASHSAVGVDWLSPTWTMAVEEQFYLVAPALIIFTPRRYLPALLMATALGAVGFRLWVVVADWPFLSARVTLMGRADLFALGILAALAFKHGWCESAPRALAVRVAAPVCMLVFAGLIVVAGDGSTLFRAAGPLVIAIAAAMFILSLAQGAPEGQRLEGGVLRFFGHNSFAIYLSHMPLLWLMHGHLLGARPSIASAEGFVVTLAALPLCLVVSRVLTITIEEPFTSLGRSFRWSEERR